MTSQFASLAARTGHLFLAPGQGGQGGTGQNGVGAIGTQPLQAWITGNIVPLLLLVIAIVLLWIGGRGDNAGVARRGISLVVGLVVLGIALSGKAGDVGTAFAKLITG